MPITIDDELATLCLCAAAKAGFPDVAQRLLDAGVDADSMIGVALTVAERYGDQKTIEVLRGATTDREELYRRAALRDKLNRGSGPAPS